MCSCVCAKSRKCDVVELCSGEFLWNCAIMDVCRCGVVDLLSCGIVKLWSCGVVLKYEGVALCGVV